MARQVQALRGRLGAGALAIDPGPTPGGAIKPTTTTSSWEWNSATFDDNSGGLITVDKTTISWWEFSTGTTQNALINTFTSVGGAQNVVTTAPSNGGFTLIVKGVAATNVIVYAISTVRFPKRQWRHTVVSYNHNTSTINVAVNGFLIPPGSFTSTTFDSTASSWESGGSNELTFEVRTWENFSTAEDVAAGQYYINFEDFIDLTVAANRAKFITSDFEPLAGGADGSNFTGNQPQVFNEPSTTNVLRNLGKGPNADTLNGAVSDTGNTPTAPARFSHNTGQAARATLSQLTSTLGVTTDQTQFTVSMWFRSENGLLGKLFVVGSPTRIGLEATFDGSGVITVTGINSSGTTVLVHDGLAVGNTDITDGSWHHIGLSINMSATLGADAVELFVDNVDHFGTTSTFTSAASFDFSTALTEVAVLNAPTAIDTTNTQGEYSQFWCDPGSFVDFSVAATRALFVGFVTTPLPIDLGSAGATPTGSSPLIFLGEGPTFVDVSLAFPHAVNKGTFSGSFTISGGPWEESASATACTPAHEYLG